ncbi:MULTISPECIES: glutamate-cysteine ligase family protein [Salinibaculum]|uniref:glutamate-cysteine ligase family protein n=1 Tax=Salinibaculum TaxID=2732368 RepID=UPI0036189318
MSERPEDQRQAHSSGIVSPAEPAPVRRSVEVEYWVVDDEGWLTEPGDLVEASPGVEREFVAPLLEIKTSPCTSTGELRTELFDRLARVLRQATSQGKHLVPLATPVCEQSIENLPSERTEIQDRIIGENFDYVRHCAGTHIHVEQQPERAIDQLNTLIALDPALALVNSSPYFEREYLATGARSELYRWKAYETLPHQGQLWPYVDDMEEWAQLLERRYGEFVTEAIVSGFDRERVEEHFEPESAVWTPVKLREEFSTVEWRSPDTTLPSQVIQLADDVSGIIEHLVDADVHVAGTTGRITDEEIILPEFDAVQEYVAAGIRAGLSSSSVRSYLERMGFDVSAYEPMSEVIGSEGDLTASEARQLRLECADRLEKDVRQRRALHSE